MTGDDASILLLTLLVATISTAAIALPGVAIAWWLSTSRSLPRRIVETIVSLPLVLPPSAVGLLLLRAIARVHPPVLFTFRAVVIATAVMSLPLLIRSAKSAFEEVDPRLLAVARTLGDGRARVFARVAVPLARRGIVAGMLLAFCRALGEFGATILVAGNIEGETQTLALAIFQRSQHGDDAGAQRLVLIIVVIAFVVVWTSEVLQRRNPRGMRT